MFWQIYFVFFFVVGLVGIAIYHTIAHIYWRDHGPQFKKPFQLLVYHRFSRQLLYTTPDWVKKDKFLGRLLMAYRICSTVILLGILGFLVSACYYLS